MATVRSNLNEVVAEMPKVQAAVRGQADALEGRIKALIAPHSKTGNLFRSVSVERAFMGKDYWVNIGAYYFTPLDQGFVHNFTHRRISGLHILKEAIYSA